MVSSLFNPLQPVLILEQMLDHLTTIASQQTELLQHLQADLMERHQVETTLRQRNEQLEIQVAECHQALAQTTASLQQERTRQQQTAIELWHSQQILHLVLESIPQKVFWKDRHLQYLGCNQSFAQSVELASEQIMGKQIEELPSPLPSLFQSQYERKALEEGIAFVNIEEFHLGQDGTQSWLKTTHIPLQSASGEVIGVFGCYEEITDRKLAEQRFQQALDEAKQANKLLETVINATPSLVFVKDHQFRFLLVNHSFAESFNTPVESIIGKDDLELGVPESLVLGDPDQKIRGIRQEDVLALAGKSVHNPCLHASDGRGTTRVFDARRVPLRNEQGEIFAMLGIAHDITDLKQAENALRQSEERFRFLAEVIPQQVWIALADGAIDYVNQRMLNFFGSNQHQVLGWKWYSRIHPEDRPRSLEQWQNALETGNPYEVEFRLQDPQGNYRWHLARAVPLRDDSGKILSWFGTNTDIDDRKQIEDALRQSEFKFRTIIENSTDAITLKDREGRYLLINPAGAGFLNLPVEQILGKRDEEIFTPETGRLIWTADEQVMLGGVTQTYEEIADCGGTQRIFLSTKAPYVSPLGEVQGVIGICRDITQRKLTEERLKASLEEKELLLKEVHHRVKNNMQVISSILSLQSQYVTDLQMQAILTDSRSRIRSMALIHEKLYQSGNLAQVDFAGYIRTLVHNLFDCYNTSRNLIRLNLDVAEVALDIDTAIPCGLLLNELVSNSLKHAFPNGRSGTLDISLQLQSGQITLTVRDNGIGFAELSNVEEWGSLGLRLVRALIRQVGGTLKLTSNPGTHLQITFPYLYLEKYSAEIWQQ